MAANANIVQKNLIDLTVWQREIEYDEVLEAIANVNFDVPFKLVEIVELVPTGEENVINWGYHLFWAAVLSGKTRIWCKVVTDVTPTKNVDNTHAIYKMPVGQTVPEPIRRFAVDVLHRNVVWSPSNI